MKLAEVHLKLESKHDAASSWVEASKAFLKSDQRRECWGRPRVFFGFFLGEGSPAPHTTAVGCCCTAAAGRLITSDHAPLHCR